MSRSKSARAASLLLSLAASLGRPRRPQARRCPRRRTSRTPQTISCCNNAAALRDELITAFRKDTTKQMTIYGYVVRVLRLLRSSGIAGDFNHFNPWPHLADIRSNYYNLTLRVPPLLTTRRCSAPHPETQTPADRTPEWLIGRIGVASPFCTEDLMAIIAGVTPATQAEMEQCLRSHAARFVTPARRPIPLATGSTGTL
jgi:hypothetical protein